MTEPMRVRWLNGFWVVELFSLATNLWIVQGEHLTKEAAEAARKSWLVERGVEWKDWPPTPVSAGVVWPVSWHYLYKAMGWHWPKPRVPGPSSKLPEVSRASHYS